MLLGVSPTEKFLKIIIGYFIYSNARKTALSIEHMFSHWVNDSYESPYGPYFEELEEFLDF